MLRYSHNAKVFGQPFEWKNTKKYKMMSMRFDTYRVDENIIFRNRNNTVTAFLMLHCSFKKINSFNFIGVTNTPPWEHRLQKIDIVSNEHFSAIDLLQSLNALV